MNQRVIDHTLDGGALLGPLLHEQPQLMQAIETSTKLASAISAPRAGFAWPEAGLFPIHTPENAALSYVYAGLQADDVPRTVKVALAHAVQAYQLDVPSLLGAIRTRGVHSHNQKVASPALPQGRDEDWALPEHRRLPLRSAEETKTAARVLLEWYGTHAIPPRAMTEACVRIVDAGRAQKLASADLPEDIYRFAGYTQCDPVKLADAIHERAHYAQDEAAKQLYLKLSSQIHGLSQKARGKLMSDRVEMTKFANQLDMLDRCTGVASRWNKEVLPPAHTVFNCKFAGALVDLGDMQADLVKMARVPAESYADVLGKEFVDEVTSSPGGPIDMQKLATIVPTLPLDMRRQLARHLGHYIKA